MHTVMGAEVFKDFRLVGGTALSLQLGHRISVDIDLFTDLSYGSAPFEQIESFLSTTFPVTHTSAGNVALGKSYLIGGRQDQLIKLDLFYTDTFIFPAIHVDGWRMASVAEIAAMKIDVIQRGGRKKDFWDLHELLEHHSLFEMLEFHRHRYEYTHDQKEILNKLTDFSLANDDFDPICLKGKYWAFIKEDIEDAVQKVCS